MGRGFLLGEGVLGWVYHPAELLQLEVLVLGSHEPRRGGRLAMNQRDSVFYG